MSQLTMQGKACWEGPRPSWPNLCEEKKSEIVRAKKKLKDVIGVKITIYDFPPHQIVVRSEEGQLKCIHSDLTKYMNNAQF